MAGNKIAAHKYLLLFWALAAAKRCVLSVAVAFTMDPGGPSQGHTFGQRQPPLYVTIHKILDKYPDGQIFKVRNLAGSADNVSHACGRQCATA